MDVPGKNLKYKPNVEKYLKTGKLPNFDVDWKKLAMRIREEEVNNDDIWRTLFIASSTYEQISLVLKKLNKSSLWERQVFLKDF